MKRSFFTFLLLSMISIQVFYSSARGNESRYFDCSFSNSKLWISIDARDKYEISARAQIYHQSANKFTYEDLTVKRISQNTYSLNTQLAGYSLGYFVLGEKTIIYSTSDVALSICRFGTPDIGGGGGDGGGGYP